MKQYRLYLMLATELTDIPGGRSVLRSVLRNDHRDIGQEYRRSRFTSSLAISTCHWHVFIHSSLYPMPCHGAMSVAHIPAAGPAELIQAGQYSTRNAVCGPAKVVHDVAVPAFLHKLIIAIVAYFPSRIDNSSK